MTTVLSERQRPMSGKAWVVLVSGVILLELLALVLVYQFLLDFSCVGRADQSLCAVIGKTPARAISFLAIGALFAAARWPSLAPLLAPEARADAWRAWAALQLTGVALMLAPAAVATATDFDLMTVGLPLWAFGAPMAVVGALLCLARPAAWATFLRTERWTVAALVVVAAALPALVTLSNALWRWDPVTNVTFAAVASVLEISGLEIEIDPSRHYIALGEFAVLVAASCSGVQGFGLVLVFVGVFAALFRDELRFPNIWLLIPIGVAISWTLNVVRVSALIMIGAFHSPDLAVNGFHSHAGWLFFTVIALGLTLTARALPFFSLNAAARAAGGSPIDAAPAPPLLQDWRAAQIAPFMVFMASALLASTFFVEPALAYPLRAVAMATALWAFRAHYLRLPWSVDGLAVASGVAIGVLWIALTPVDAVGGALAALGPVVFAFWAVCRVIGTVALVPLIEELLFRDYLMGRFNDGRWTTRLMTLGASTVLFALLHGRWFEAGIAGLVFGLIYMRRGRLCDAVVSHAVANAMVAGYAVATGAWTAI